MLVNLSIPEKAKINFKIGDKINFNEPLFEIENKEEIKIFITEKININPNKIFDSLKKNIGDFIKKGDIVAEKKSFFSSTNFTCDVEGYLKEINHEDGSIIISHEKSSKQIINSFFSGVLEKMQDNLITIELKNGHEFSLENANNDFGGEIFVIKSDDDFFAIHEEQVENKIVICEKANNSLVSKCKALGAKAFIFVEESIDESKIIYAKLKNKADFNKIISLKNKNAFISKLEKVLVLYDF